MGVPTTRGAAVVFGPAGCCFGWFNGSRLQIKPVLLWFGAFLSCFRQRSPRGRFRGPAEKKERTKRRLGLAQGVARRGHATGWPTARPSKRPRRAPQVWTQTAGASAANGIERRGRARHGRMSAGRCEWDGQRGLVTFPRWIPAVPSLAWRLPVRPLLLLTRGRGGSKQRLAVSLPMWFESGLFCLEKGTSEATCLLVGFAVHARVLPSCGLLPRPTTRRCRWS